jgi:pimeloyl-ACP methyl ester carboxylesterase
MPSGLDLRPIWLASCTLRHSRGPTGRLEDHVLREYSVTPSGVRLNVAEGPDSGPPLLLLHGITGRWQGFLPLLPFLVQRYHVYALDLRGHGESARTPGDYGGERYATDVAEVIERHIGGPVLLFGHSLGGLIALRVALARPTGVRALVIGDSPLSWERYRNTPHRAGLATVLGLVREGLPVAELARRIADLPVPVPGATAPLRYGDLPSNDGASIRGYASNLVHADPEAIGTIVQGGLGSPDGPIEELAAGLTMPCLLLQANAALGSLMASEDVERVLAVLPDGTLARLPTLGHSLHGQDPVPVARAVLQFFESV